MTLCQIIMPQLDDDEDIRARRRTLAERELALREAEIEAVSMRCDGSLVTFAMVAGIRSFCSEWMSLCFVQNPR